MTPFADWNLQRQKRFWRQSALELLPRWRLNDAKLSWLGYSSNAVFKAQTHATAHVLRLHPPGSVREDHLLSELHWLQRIRRATDLFAPLPISPSDSRHPFVSWTSGHFPGQTGYAVLFEFIEGMRKTPDALNDDDMRRFGAFLGELHQSAQFNPGAGFARPRFDHAAFFADESPYGIRESCIELTPDQRAIFAETEQAVAKSLRVLGASPQSRGLIHGDLLLKNVLFLDEKVAALDFEYCAFGPFLYDLAPMIWQLRGDRPADCAELEASLWHAYTAIRPAAAHERSRLEAMVAARQLASCRWLLSQLHNPGIRYQAPELLSARAAELRDYLATGDLRRHSRTL